MPDRSSMPAPAPLGAGQITRMSVTYTVPTAEGPFRMIHGLNMMRGSARTDRVQDLVYDLAVICEEVLAARSSSGKLPPSVVRLPFQPPPGPVQMTEAAHGLRDRVAATKA